ncbi:MAG TPA: HNH endonuclease [Vicinamibacterales bacterium]|nr:HNH endonuclease [Vicinamibacterales bacterium]
MTIPLGYCQCGCGHKTAICNRNWKRFGYVAGQPFRFIPGHNRRATRNPRVYVNRRVAGDPRGTVNEHVLVAEAALGKRLPRSAQVHHVDGNRRNNTRANLVICENQAYHLLLHVRARTVAAGGDPNIEQVCSVCGSVKPLDQFDRQRTNIGTGRTSQCKGCKARYYKVWYARHAERRKAAKEAA